VLGTDLACRPFGFGDRAQTLGIVVRLQTLAHRLARLRGNYRLRPERIVYVQAPAALLPEARDAALRILGGESPHAEATQAAGVANGGGESGRTEPTHWRLEDRPLEVEPFGDAFLDHIDVLP
jgi:hypothetical protein